MKQGGGRQSSPWTWGGKEYTVFCYSNMCNYEWREGVPPHLTSSQLDLANCKVRLAARSRISDFDDQHYVNINRFFGLEELVMVRISR